VVACGAGVGAFSPGDRVIALLPGGGYADYVTVSAATVMRMPSHLSWAEAGSLAEAWVTAYQLVVILANVQRGDVVLIYIYIYIHVYVLSISIDIYIYIHIYIYVSIYLSIHISG